MRPDAETAHFIEKKIQPYEKPSHEMLYTAGGYRIGFLQFHPYEKKATLMKKTQSRWLLNYSSTYNSNE